VTAVMKVRVDAAKCSGHGRCYDLAPEVFAEGEQSHCHIPDENVPAGLEAKARLAQANCPEEAIEIEES
jgi:ferredoxin